MKNAGQVFSMIKVFHRHLASRTSVLSSTASVLPASTSRRTNLITTSSLNLRQKPFAYTAFNGFSSKRYLSLHEFQSKDLLEKFSLNIQRGRDASTPEEAYEVARSLKSKGARELVIKCQVLAGGRGKGRLSSGLQGGVKVCSTPEEVRDYARQMLNYRLVTHQTTSEGELVKKVLVLESVNINKELYLALVMDRKHNTAVFVASQMGGVEIEEVAEKMPEAIRQIPVKKLEAELPYETAQTVADALGFSESQGVSKATVDMVAKQIRNLYKLFLSCDSTQVEVNPLAITDKQDLDQHLMCVDAKIAFDDNSAFRQKPLFAMEDKDSMDIRERAAEKAGLNFVGLDGNVGCLVNGAGLAMSTMDIIKLHGGNPANFLDVGGGADEEQVTEAFRILQSDPNVKVLFVNIFGGIMRCDTIAQGLVNAARMVDLKLPLVVRLVGNRVDIGKEILKTANLPNIHAEDDFETAAKTAACLAAAI